MSYGKKSEDNELLILERIKDYSSLTSGKQYQLRKFISQEGMIVFNDVYDIILKEYVNGIVIEQDTNIEFNIGPGEFEIFFKRKI